MYHLREGPSRVRFPLRGTGTEGLPSPKATKLVEIYGLSLIQYFQVQLEEFSRAMDRFTSEQIREYNDAFMMFDRDGSGDIGSIELRDMLKTVGFNPTDILLERLTLEIDNDGNGMINFEEFMALIDGLEDWEKNDREAHEAFNAFDVMGRGYIESKDIEAAMMFIMSTATEEERQDVVRHFKLKPNRKVYFKEFKDMLTQKP